MKTGKITIRQIVACLLIISFSLLINVTSYAEIIKPPTCDTSESEVVSPYENGRYVKDERGFDILLLDIEWYTYETFMEDNYTPLVEAREKGELDTERVYYYYGYGGNYIETNDPLEVIEKTALTIKYNKREIARTINGKSAKDLDYPINRSITNNGPEVLAEERAFSYDENGYYKFNIGYSNRLILFASFDEENGINSLYFYSLGIEDPLKFVEDINYIDHENDYTFFFIRNNEEYKELIETQFLPDLKKMCDDGLITEEYYEYYINSTNYQSRLDYYINLFFS